QLDPRYFNETMLVFVINNMDSSSDEVKLDNQQALIYLRNLISGNPEDVLSKEILSKEINIGIIDAASVRKTMPNKEGGVGLARKIGMDIALNVFDFNAPGKKLILTTDADCTLQSDYLTEIVSQSNKRNISAGVVKFQHDISGDDIFTRAIICYEIFLRYYVLGLKFAGSPYAFHTIGSTMFCDFESYVKIEGMNKRKAAEDFYFLEKLAKNIDIGIINTTTVYPDKRGSWRVPFGTGQRVNRFLAGIQNEYTLYNPQVFIILKEWLEVLSSTEKTEIDFYLQRAREIHPELIRFLRMRNFEDDMGNILRTSKTGGQLKIQKRRWFDGFMTLKFIHHLRDNGLGEINMFDAMDEIFNYLLVPWIPEREKDSIPELAVRKDYLEILRQYS
ncbi:MAG TPA: hypothetical protein VLB50_09015, partial [Ignavibacteriaceae bacterium]|nr:hypothetical protein [Ignavibacteriaceae bacterium]